MDQLELVSAWLKGQEIEYLSPVTEKWEIIESYKGEELGTFKFPQEFKLLPQACRIKEEREKKSEVHKPLQGLDFDELYELFYYSKNLEEKFKQIILNKVQVLEHFLFQCVDGSVENQKITNSFGDPWLEEYNDLLKIYQRYH